MYQDKIKKIIDEEINMRCGDTKRLNEFLIVENKMLLEQVSRLNDKLRELRDDG
jgi:hypothetical protein